MSAKEEHSKRAQSKKISTGKISSKQIGEEISKEEESGSQMARVSDAGRFWPLLCFELSISVEQEDRLLETQKRLREGEGFRRNENQILTAARLASSLKEAVLYALYLTTFRQRKAYLDILTPKQAILYQEWLLSNRNRAENVLKERKRLSIAKIRGVTESRVSDGSGKDDLNPEELGYYLEKSLKVTKNMSPGSCCS